MNILEKHKKRLSPHKYHSVLKKYHYPEIARSIGISASHLRGVLCGAVSAGKETEARICALAEQILAAEKNQELQEVTG